MLSSLPCAYSRHPSSRAHKIGLRPTLRYKNKNEKVNDDEKEELRLLEAIADVMGIKTATEKKGSMDEFL